jgi:predicted nucleic acid-binding protein
MLAAEVGCSLFDALFLLVSQELSALFITADERLYNQVRTRFPQTRLLRDYSP